MWTVRESERDVSGCGLSERESERNVSGCGLSERERVSAMCQGMDSQRETAQCVRVWTVRERQ